MNETRARSEAVELERYGRKRLHYQRPEVARSYVEARWSTPGRRRSLRRDRAAVERALDLAESRDGALATCLEVACGPGRFFDLLRRRGIAGVGSDLSHAMLRVAGEAPDARGVPLVRAEAEALPFRTDAFDAVLCVRFLFHLPRSVRVAALSEMRRVARRWVVVDARHRHNLGYRLRRLGWRTGLRSSPPRRLSRAELEAELVEAGLELAGLFPTARVLTDKWVVTARVGQPPGRSPAGSRG